MKKGPEYAGAFLLQSGNTTRYKPPRELQTYEHAVGTEIRFDPQGVSYKTCWVAETNLDEFRVAGHEFCELKARFRKLLPIGNSGVVKPAQRIERLSGTADGPF